ncbi:MAG: HlyD family efflux transporter periplasmic adaptor subunit [Phycisphaerae bacterium]
MKKLFIGLIVAAGIIVVSVWGLRGLRLKSFLDGKDEQVIRGDLVIPVAASGSVEANELVEIKAKASGEVQAIHVVPGQMVQKDELLAELDPVDEKRNVQRTQAAYDRAASMFEQSKIRLEENKQNRPLDATMAEERLAQMDAQLEQAQIEFDRLQDISDKTEIETRRVANNLASAKAVRDQAQAEFDRATNNVDLAIGLAEQDVAVAKAAMDVAKQDLDDANQRLSETKIHAPLDGMVYSIRVRRGEVIQSGKTSLTGGTALMYIADVSRMYVMAQVDEADIGAVTKIAPDFARPGKTRLVTDEELIASAPLPPIGTIGDADAEAAAAEEIQVETPDLTGRRVKVSVDAYRDDDFEGIIERILPEPVQIQNVVTFKVRIRVLGSNLHRLMGLEADVQFTADRVSGALLVKNEALVSEGKDVYVYVPFRDSESDPWFEKKIPVEIGLTDGTFTHIREGLDEGARVWVKRPRLTQRERKREQGRT